MEITGIICEYNPFHLGHQKQLDIVRAQKGTDHGIVCLMSGNFVQRGHPAMLHKSLRAQAAVRCGADLVLELPVTAALSSAEGFAARGVEILAPFCGELCFGAESSDDSALMDIARALLSDAFPSLLRSRLDKGLSFPAARQAALEEMGLNGSLVTQPNNILAIEYCKAILSQNAVMKPFPILRQGSYHDAVPDPENPSATAVRELLKRGHDWKSCVPNEAQAVFDGSALHTLAAGERAILARLRTMEDDEFEALPYGSEGLWRKFMHASRREASIAAITAATKSKRYTATRIDRMLLCAFLGITEECLSAPAPYVRALAFDDTGRTVLKQAREKFPVINAGESVDHPYYQMERRCADLYALTRLDSVDPPGDEERQRVFYHKEKL